MKKVVGKILYATDFSSQSEKAADFVKALKPVCSKVVVLHVVDRATLEAYEDAMLWSGKFESRDKLVKMLTKKAESKLRKIAEKFENESFEVELDVELGKPWRVILNIAGREKVDLIVIGSHGCSQNSLCDLEAVIGSTAEKVVRHSNLPVVVVK